MDELDLKFAIVLFTNYETKTKKKVIDLVPKSWLVCNKTWKCFYPPPHVKNVTDLVKKQAKPNPSWEKYKIKIIKRARDHDQGLRRLKRACSEAHVDSTQSENSNMSAEDERVDSKNSDKSIDKMEINDTCSTISTPRTLQSEIKYDNNYSFSTPRKSSTKINVLKRKIISDSEDTSSIEDSNSKKELKRKHSESVHRISSKNPDYDLHIRMDQLHNDMKNLYKKLSKELKSIKNSILYDFNKKIEAIKNTIAFNASLVVEDDLKIHKENLAIQFPITTDEEFFEFDTIIKANNDKTTALKAIMASYLGSATELKEAVRKILGNIITKKVQEFYSAAGRKNPSGIAKKNFSATHVYSCMTDVIKSRIDKADEKTILSTTSRYLSGAGDREGGKAIRDARKYKNTS